VPHDAHSEPLASWESTSGQWLNASGMSEDLFGQSEPFSGRWPASVSMRKRSLYLPQTQGHPTSGNGSSFSPGLLPTPRTADGLNETMTVTRARLENGARWRGTIEEAVSLLPTPAAGNPNDGEQLETWEARYRAHAGKATDATRAGTPLAIAAQRLLRTPTAQLAVNGGSQHPDKRRAGGHGPTLADEVEHELLPTPRATDGTKGGPHQHGSSGDLMLPSAVMTLLPTPEASDGSGGRVSSEVGGTRPSGTIGTAVAHLLPTPRPQVNGGGAAAEDPPNRQGGPNLMTTVSALLPTPNATDWKGSGSTQGRDRDGRPRPPGDQDLPEAVSALLPTPTGRDAKGQDLPSRTGGPSLPQALLPTPSAALGSGGQTSRSGDRIGEPLLSGIAEQAAAGTLLPTPTVSGSHGTDRRSDGTLLLPGAVRDLLPTPTSSDSKSSGGYNPAWGYGVTLTDAARELSTGGHTLRRSAGGKPSSDGLRHVQLSLDEQVSDFPRGSSSS
jgi:hypothetical protein